MKYRIKIKPGSKWEPAAAWYYRNFAHYTGEDVAAVTSLFHGVRDGKELIIEILDNSIVEEATIAAGLEVIPL